MNSWKKAAVDSNAAIRDALKVIDRAAINVALVVDGDDRLIGLVTDGDVRRGLLRGLTLDDPVEAVCNKNPITAPLSADRDALNQLMARHDLHQIPILDPSGKVVRIKVIDELLQTKERENLVVLMAGGRGTRLGPLTRECPKPLLKIGHKPILETIIENFTQYGFNQFVISLNYKASMIRDYFKDGSKWGVHIEYTEEDEPLGTAGALSILPEKPKEPFFVMNADLLTRINFFNMLEYHIQHNVAGTMGVREYSIQVPYGVIYMDDHKINKIEEKPVSHFFVNSGIYVLDPRCIKMIPRNTFYDMPTLFEKMIEDGIEVCSFPIMEYWIDIGQMHDLERAKGEYFDVFDK